MTQPVLDQFFGMIEDQARRKNLEAIHATVDEEFFTALGEWCDERHVKVATVLATVSFFLAHTLYTTSKGEDDACYGANLLGDYIHCVTHTMFLEASEEPTTSASKKHH